MPRRGSSHRATNKVLAAVIEKLEGRVLLSGASFPAATIADIHGDGNPLAIAAYSTTPTAPTITSANSTTFTAGTFGFFTILTTGSPTPSVIESGLLPKGVTFAPHPDGTATLSGTPRLSAGGIYDLNLTADNGITPSGTQTFILTIDQAPLITSAPSATFTIGQTSSFTVTTSAFPTVATIIAGGTLPDGISFVDNHNGSATISGTPTLSGGGTYLLNITANNGVTQPATQAFTLTVNLPPSITSSPAATFTTGTANSFTITTVGFPTNVALTESGPLPTGVTFTDQANGSATISGTPQAGTGNTYTLVLKAKNGVTPVAKQTFVLTVDQPPAITSNDIAIFMVGTLDKFPLITTGFPAPALTETGPLPTGVTFHQHPNGTIALVGIPAPGTAGAYALTLTAANGVAANATQAFTLDVDQPPSITSSPNGTFRVGKTRSITITTAGFPIPILSEIGPLPAGVTFHDNGDGTATISGTPAAGAGNIYNLTLQAASTIPASTTQLFTLTVNQPPLITSSASATFAVGAPAHFKITSDGFPTPTVIATGSLPNGITLHQNVHGGATLAGIPAPGTGGVYILALEADNGAGEVTDQTFQLTVIQPPAITSAASVTYLVGTTGSFIIQTTAFPTAAITEIGTLPAGVTFQDNADGAATLAGTPTTGTGGTYVLTLKAKNGHTPSAKQTFTLTVDEPPTITSSAAQTFTTGAAGSFMIQTTGFPANATITKNGALPLGLTFANNNDGTATLSGTPAPGTGGVYTLSLTAHNGITPAFPQTFTLTINQPPSITSPAQGVLQLGDSGSILIATAGFPLSALTEMGILPDGVTFLDNANGTATLSGIPASGTAGMYVLSIKAKNNVSPAARQTFTLTVMA